jgi:hypothetical protein
VSRRAAAQTVGGHAAFDALAARLRDALQGLHLALQADTGLPGDGERGALLARSLTAARQTASMLARLADPRSRGGRGTCRLAPVVVRARAAALPEGRRPTLELPDTDVKVGLEEAALEEIVQRFLVGADAARACGMPWSVRVPARGSVPRLDVEAQDWRVSIRALRALTGDPGWEGMPGLGDLQPAAWELLVASRLCAAHRGRSGADPERGNTLWLELPPAPAGRGLRPPRLRIV